MLLVKSPGILSSRTREQHGAGISLRNSPVGYKSILSNHQPIPFMPTNRATSPHILNPSLGVSLPPAWATCASASPIFPGRDFFLIFQPGLFLFCFMLGYFLLPVWLGYLSHCSRWRASFELLSGNGEVILFFLSFFSGFLFSLLHLRHLSEILSKCTTDVKGRCYLRGKSREQNMMKVDLE